MRAKSMSLLVCLSIVWGLAACGGGTATVTVADETAAPVASPAPTTTPAVPPEEVAPLPAPAATFEQAPCPFPLPAGQVDGDTVDCGYLTVPEDRSDPDTRTIRLAVAIFHPPDGATEPDPILYLEGGPGASVLERIWMLFDRFEPVLDANRDLIVFDQRGVGFSEPVLDCPVTAELGLDLMDGIVDGQALTDQEAYDLLLDSFIDCGRALGADADLSAYNSVASAADVNDLRLALGPEQGNLWATSYGTRLALGVLRDYPEGIRSAVLDSAYPPDVDLHVSSPANLDRSLNLLFDACAAEEACNTAFPDLRTVLFDTVRDLDADPVLTTLTNPQNGETYDAEIDGATFLSLILQLMYETEVLPAIPQFIYESSEGNLETVRLMLGQFLAIREISSRGMAFSVQCHEELAFGSWAELQAALREFPELVTLYELSLVGRLPYDVCEKWDSGRAGPEENQAVTSDLPILLMSGEFDPVTPPAWGQHAAETLENDIFVEFPGVGHGASVVPGCPQDMMIAFLDDPTRPPDGACVAGMGIRFAVPTEGAVELVPFRNEQMGISGLAPDGWAEVRPGVYSRGSSALDTAVLIAQAAPTSSETLLQALIGQLGLDESPASVGQREANELTWTLYYAQVQGIEIDFALAESDSLAMIALLQSMPAEHDGLYEGVFLPVLDSLVPEE